MKGSIDGMGVIESQKGKDFRKTRIDKAEAVAVMMEKYEICCDMFHGFDWGAWTTGTPADRLSLLPEAQEHVLAQEDGKKRYMQAVKALSQAFTLAVPHAKTRSVQDDVASFQAIRELLAKSTGSRQRSPEETEHAIKQLVSKAVSSNEVVDIFASAGLVLGDETLKTIARELVEAVRKNNSIDWTARESVRAKMRVIVKRILRNHGYPPDKQEKAVNTVLEQAESIVEEWAAA